MRRHRGEVAHSDGARRLHELGDDGTGGAVLEVHPEVVRVEDAFVAGDEHRGRLDEALHAHHVPAGERLLHETRLRLDDGRAVAQRIGEVPSLIGVGEEQHLGADRFAHGHRGVDVEVDVLADLHLDERVAGADRLGGLVGHLLGAAAGDVPDRRHPAAHQFPVVLVERDACGAGHGVVHRHLDGGPGPLVVNRDATHQVTVLGDPAGVLASEHVGVDTVDQVHRRGEALAGEVTGEHALSPADDTVRGGDPHDDAGSGVDGGDRHLQGPAHREPRQGMASITVDLHRDVPEQASPGGRLARWCQSGPGWTRRNRASYMK